MTEETIESLRRSRDGWRMNALNGWAALHSIREVLTELAPPGSLPNPDVVFEGPEHLHEAGLLINANHALHRRAVNAETNLAELQAA